MHYFFIASRGLTASTWFCNALNSSEQIYCSHGRDNPYRCLNVRELINDKAYRSDRLKYEQWQRKATLTEYITELKRASSKETYLGNVHGYILPELIDKLKEVNLYNKIPITNMTRNPIEFLESYTCLVMQNVIEYPEKYYSEHLPRAKKNMNLLRTFSDAPETDYEMQGFIEACIMLKKMISDFEYDHIPVIKMEQLTTDQEYFKEIVGFLTNDVVKFDQSVLEKIFKTGKINSHRGQIQSSANNKHSEKIKISPQEIWGNWPDNKKNIFSKLIEKKEIGKFISLGYNLSYL